MSDVQKYAEIFDYLSAPDAPVSPEPTVVFGRKDPLVARAAGDLVVAGLAGGIVITGGIGKDSGDILEQGFRSEAHYLGSELDKNLSRRVPEIKPPHVVLEEEATNGGENARNSLAILAERAIDLSHMTGVAHATSARRLGETLKFEAEKQTGGPVVVHRVPSAYRFDPKNPADQKEAAAELLRMADWPAKGWLGPQTELPDANLVDFVRDVHGNAPKPVSAWQSALLRRMPVGIRTRVIDLASRRHTK